MPSCTAQTSTDASSWHFCRLRPRQVGPAWIRTAPRLPRIRRTRSMSPSPSRPLALFHAPAHPPPRGQTHTDTHQHSTNGQSREAQGGRHKHSHRQAHTTQGPRLTEAKGLSQQVRNKNDGLLSGGMAEYQDHENLNDSRDQMVHLLSPFPLPLLLNTMLSSRHEIIRIDGQDMAR